MHPIRIGIVGLGIMGRRYYSSVRKAQVFEAWDIRTLALRANSKCLVRGMHQPRFLSVPFTQNMIY